MSRDLNKCFFIGRLGNDPEMRAMPNGNSVANLTIAVGDDYKDKSGQKVEQTEWIRVCAFGPLADVMREYLKKGSKVHIEGKMKTRKYEKDGVTHYATEIHASEMQMLDSKPQEGRQESRPAESKQHKQPVQQPAQQPDFEDDIPFN